MVLPWKTRVLPWKTRKMMVLPSLGPNSLPAGQADPAERLGFRCAMVSMPYAPDLSPVSNVFPI